MHAPLPFLGFARSRRDFLRQAFWTAGAIMTVGGAAYGPRASAAASPIASAGALGAPDANGIRLPAGWQSRVVAVSGLRPAKGSAYRWHSFPDGGATFAAEDGGWVYANNSESLRGGVGVLRFDAGGQVISAGRVLSGTVSNCAGGKTPWQSWLSCEEKTNGQVWEAFPFGSVEDARALPALGFFAHEAAAVDPKRKVVYLTEDEGDGRFYRFKCSSADWPEGAERPALQDGVLQVMEVAQLGPNVYPSDHVDVTLPQSVQWVDVVSPDQPQSTVREQLGAGAPGAIFKGGEGLWYHKGIAYFSTKGDNRIWAFDPKGKTIECIYDFASATEPNNVLSGVDNLTVSPYGDVLVAEDGGNMELCALLPNGSVKVILQVVGQDESEITGPAFSPDGRRLYFNSQRGSLKGLGLGITYEILLPA